MKKETETADKQDKEFDEKELDEKELEKVSGGIKRSSTGPGTQTEDDVYVG